MDGCVEEHSVARVHYIPVHYYYFTILIYATTNRVSYGAVVLLTIQGLEF